MRTGRRPRRTSWLVAGAVATALAILVPAVASAHPLGNFTINHYAGIRVTPTGLALDVVIDQAEIPTFSERQRIDRDGDGQVSASELEVERQSACDRLGPSLALTVDDVPQPLHVEAAGLSFPPGAGGLSTMRLVCEYAATPAPPLTTASTVHFADGSNAGRIGWREIVLIGDRMTISGSTLGAAGVSSRLTHYPADLLAVPLAQTEATFTASPGGPAADAPCIPDAFPLTSAPTDSTPGVGCLGAASSGAPAASAGSIGSISGSGGSGATSGGGGSAGGSTTLAGAVAAVPGGVGGDVAGLLETRDLTPAIVLFSILTAMALGAAHAVTPGHGKTIMAAYLVGTKGTPRHALALGLTVTVSHTMGVLLLALVILSVSRITPESFNHVAGIVSGLLVVSIGGWLFLRQGLPLIRERVATWRDGRAREVAHAAAHAAGIEHEAAHASGTEHDHATDRHVHGLPEPGWHEHGGRGHTHLPSDGTTLTWRSLFALGLFGGLVPSINALIILLATLATGRAAFGLVLVVAFGAGMAIVLGGIGLGLVYASRRMARAGSIPLRRVVAWAPALTAVVILGVGLWVTGQAIWGSPVL